MIDEGIYEGMRVLVRRQNHYENGKIGVVVVDGEEGIEDYDGKMSIYRIASFL